MDQRKKTDRMFSLPVQFLRKRTSPKRRKRAIRSTVWPTVKCSRVCAIERYIAWWRSNLIIISNEREKSSSQFYSKFYWEKQHFSTHYWCLSIFEYFIIKLTLSRVLFQAKIEPERKRATYLILNLRGFIQVRWLFTLSSREQLILSAIPCFIFLSRNRFFTLTSDIIRHSSVRFEPLHSPRKKQAFLRQQ